MLKLVEEYSGVGDLMVNGQRTHQVRYNIARYQGILQSGLPLPGLHRIEGSIAAESGADISELAGSHVTLRLEDGRALNLTLTGPDGRVLNEGHGPGRCLCC